jgi:hypothetical protein
MSLSFLFRKDFGLVDLEQGKLAAIGSWDNTLTVTAVEDIGRVISQLIYVTPDYRKQRVRFQSKRPTLLLGGADRPALPSRRGNIRTGASY